jgi:hypothetical protein
MQDTHPRPFGITSVVATSVGFVSAAALLFLWPLPDLGPDDGPMAGLVVLEPLAYVVVISAVTSIVGLSMGLMSLARHERQTKGTTAALVVNACVSGSILAFLLLR